MQKQEQEQEQQQQQEQEQEPEQEQQQQQQQEYGLVRRQGGLFVVTVPVSAALLPCL